MKRNPGYLLNIGDEIIPNYMEIIINHYKDPYQSTSTMESMCFFFCVALLFCNQLREQNLAAALAAQGMGGIMAGISW